MLAFGGVSLEDRILEVGCGMGRYTLLFADRGYRIEGLDLTQGLLDQLHGFDDGRYGIRTHCLDILDRPAELRESFDVVIGLFMLHHVHDLDGCIAALRHYLRPGGRFLFLEPNPLNPLYYLQILFTPRMRWQAENGILDMGRRRLTLAGTRAGMGAVRFKRFGLFPPQLANLRFGQQLERVLERVPGIGPFRAFNLVEMVEGGEGV